MMKLKWFYYDKWNYKWFKMDILKLKLLYFHHMLKQCLDHKLLVDFLQWYKILLQVIWNLIEYKF